MFGRQRDQLARIINIELDANASYCDFHRLGFFEIRKAAPSVQLPPACSNRMDRRNQQAKSRSANDATCSLALKILRNLQPCRASLFGRKQDLQTVTGTDTGLV